MYVANDPLADHGDGESAAFGHIRLERSVDGIATIEMADVEGRNALSSTFAQDLLRAIEHAVACERVKVVVLAGLPDVFCAGATREVLEEVVSGHVVPGDLQLTRALLEIPVPLIAAMEGHAIGGGLALGLCADITLIARESRYGCTFMNLGFTPGMGVTRLLESMVPPAVAHEMMYTGEAFKGSHFADRGGFNYVLPRAQVRPKALELAASIADKPSVALTSLKRVLAAGKRQAFEASRADEVLLHTISFAQPDLLRRIEERYVG
jgi:polyketide biosynthesis enoyl-CoA hydratase PksI